MNPLRVPQAAPSAVSLADILENPVLLRIIFTQMSPEDAMELRLVNKTWNKAAIPALKKHADDIYLFEGSDPNENRRNEQFLRRLNQLTDCVFSSPNFPFTKLSIILTQIGNGPAWNLLLRSMAPFLTHLEIFLSGGKTEVDRNPSLPGDIHFPQLKHLKMFLDDNKPEDRCMFLEKIITVAPNLKSLELWEAKRAVLQQMTRHPNLHLDKLKLEFDFGTYESFQNHQHVVNLLKSQKDSLQKLSLSAPGVRRFVEVNSISYCLPKVKALHLRENKKIEKLEPEEDDIQVCETSRLGPLEYVSKFPNLEEVYMGSIQSSCFTAFFPVNTGLPSTTVTSLRLDSLYKTTCQELMVKYVPEIFPNLTSMEVPSGFKSVVDLVTRLEHLETLIVNCEPKETADQIFGGLDIQDWHKYGRISLKPFGVIRDFKGMMDKPPFSAWHKIRTLKFDFFYDDESDHFPVSEATCRLVLLKMRNLKEVHFIARKPRENEISAAVMKQMEAKFEVFSPMDD